ncbi:hypothetical protein KL942_001560 [Ogataea angusta]|uniref:Dystroglycan-type cadherin-like domain-containing protein n=1 Tax=Pichia angusta TaxID=870730 RepID=A0ABQ7S064_PICAN|nr:hypothetical protein KL942_001560 [Ogataea angusta]KAG7850741.1 hypothetical protein KL940_001318 [Ogataea angusta]
MLRLGFLCLASLAGATPYSGFPFSQQLPDVARVGEEYAFTINKDTYRSDEGTVSYSADNMPNWLSFDESSLTFSGIPSSSDATDSLSFDLIGTDSSGTLNQSVSIVVSKEAGPELKTSIFSQLQSMGNTNGYDGLIIEPQKSFEVQFSNDTFQMSSGSSNNIVAYYGKSLNRTSLPSWCYFDEDTLTFSGTAPAINSEIAPSQEFGFILIATDYEGYTGTYGTFYLLVGAHELTTNVSDTLQINATAGESFSVQVPLQDVQLDGQSISSQNISSVKLYEAPSWVQLDSDNKLTGDVPEDQDSNELVNVTVTDVYGNQVFLDFEIDVYSELFTVDDLPDVNATRGDFFVYSLPSSAFSNLNDTDIKANFSNATWLTYYYTNHSFTGVVPDSFSELEVTIEATMNSLEDSRKFTIRGVGTVHSSTSSRSSSSTFSSSSSSGSHSGTSASSAMASPSATSESGSSSGSPNKKNLAIGLGVALPLAALLGALLIFCCCWRRRKENKDEEDDAEKKKDAFYIHPQGTAETLKNDPEGDNAKRLSALNVLKLDESGMRDDSSSLTNVESNHSRSHSLYNEAMNHQSTDELISGRSQKITKSWRNGASKWKPRDSLTSLATVATTDLLTVRVADDPNLQRKSQSIFMNRNSSYVSSGSGNYVNYDQSSSSEYVDATDRPRDLTTLDEEFGREFSDSTLSKSSAKFVDVQRKGSEAVNLPRDERSFEGVIENTSNSSML